MVKGVRFVAGLGVDEMDGPFTRITAVVFVDHYMQSAAVVHFGVIGECTLRIGAQIARND